MKNLCSIGIKPILKIEVGEKYNEPIYKQKRKMSMTTTVRPKSNEYSAYQPEVDSELNYLRHRIRNPELAVQQLQQTVYDNFQKSIHQTKQQVSKQQVSKQQEFHAYIKTVLHGTFFVIGSTIAQVIAGFLPKFERSGAFSIHCKENAVKIDE